MDGVPHVIANRYRIECEVGRGGMGTVYRALHLGLERPVAVKILKPEFAADPEVAERFMRGPHDGPPAPLSAAAIFDAGTLPDNRPFIVMEFVEGATLAEALAREGRFTPARAVGVASGIDVLAAAHSLGIVHRDLKPSNIMLSERGVRARFRDRESVGYVGRCDRTHATTNSGVIVGTPRYMSPEQCLG
ncbi:MAG: serine/threonine-protein kinase [Pyrinomonadaceae bacterium]